MIEGRLVVVASVERSPFLAGRGEGLFVLLHDFLDALVGPVPREVGSGVRGVVP